MKKDNDASVGVRPPAPPRATRMNRLAVVVAASVMSLTLVVVALMVGTKQESTERGEQQQEQAARVPQGPGRPGFLDRPPEDGPAEEEIPSLTSDPSQAGLLAPDTGLTGTPGTFPDTDPYAYSQGTETYPAPPAYGQGEYYAYEPALAATTNTRSPEEEALDRAFRSSLSPQIQGSSRSRGVGSETATPDQMDTASDLTSQGDELGRYDEMLARAQRMLSGGASRSPSGLAPQVAPGGQADIAMGASTGRHEQFIRAAVLGRSENAGYIAAATRWPISPFEIREGTLIEALLITGIHSDLAGEVVAQVSRNVYDSQTQQTLLIPKGTRLIGTYDSQVALDESRLLVAWTRLIFPDGRSIDLPGLGSKDMRGASGLTGRVNRHYWRAFGNAMMLSVVGAGLALSQQREQRSVGSGYPSPGEVAAGAVATELSRVATEILRANLGRRPTIRIREGTAFTVFMNGDLALTPYQPQDGFLR